MSKLYKRSVRGTVPYDHDLVKEDLNEVFAYSMVPFLKWDNDTFAKWLHDAIDAFLSAPHGSEEELLERKDAVNNLLMPEESVIRGGYDPMGYAVSIGNVALVQHLFLPFEYVEHSERWYQDRILVLAQKSGNIEMLKIINGALFEKKP